MMQTKPFIMIVLREGPMPDMLPLGRGCFQVYSQIRRIARMRDWTLFFRASSCAFVDNPTRTAGTLTTAG
jgi:hypothetical protein